MRQIHTVAFCRPRTARHCRRPRAPTDSYSPKYYQHIARVLEAGSFDIGFFDDRLAMPDIYG